MLRNGVVPAPPGCRLRFENAESVALPTAQQRGGGITTFIVLGDGGMVRSAVEASAAAAGAVSKVRAAYMIRSPHEEVVRDHRAAPGTLECGGVDAQGEA